VVAQGAVFSLCMYCHPCVAGLSVLLASILCMRIVLCTSTVHRPTLHSILAVTPPWPTCLLSGNGERGPEGSNEWERITSIIDFNFSRPNSTGEWNCALDSLILPRVCCLFLFGEHSMQRPLGKELWVLAALSFLGDRASHESSQRKGGWAGRDLNESACAFSGEG
jgi:hypothetical protein